MHGFEIRCYAMDGNTIFAGTTHNVYKSTDGGFTDAGWTESDSGVNLSVIESVAKSGQYVFAGSSYGVYVSTNNGNNWSGLNTGTISNAVHSLLIVGDKVLAGNDAGAWRQSYPGLPTAIAVAPRQGTVQQAALQIHPSGRNNPNMSLDFSLPEAGHVAISMYNFSGREMISLVNEYMGPGAHSLSLNTRHMSAGRYAVRMLVGKSASEQSMTISR
jgi:hypothetical protein